MPTSFQELRNFVANDRSKEALNYLNLVVTDNETRTSIILLLGKIANLDREILRTTIEVEQIQILKSQINLGTLSLIDEFEEHQSLIENQNNLIPQANAPQTNDELENLILKFLTSFNRWYFSPLRIKNFGGRQTGFEQLSNYNTSDIKAVLLNLLAEEKLRTTNSRLGNPIYKIR